MAFRGLHQDWISSKHHKNEPNNYQKKYEQMSKQQQIIEQKKLEIQQKLEEKKRKETEEALKKLQEDKPNESDSSSKRNTSQNRRQSYRGNDKGWRSSRQEETKQAPPLPTNIFSNDGSFLEQFRKLAGIKAPPKKKEENGNAAESEEMDKKTQVLDSSNAADDVIQKNENDETDKDSENKKDNVDEKEKERDRELHRRDKECRWSSEERERSRSPPKVFQQQQQQQQPQAQPGPQQQQHQTSFPQQQQVGIVTGTAVMQVPTQPALTTIPPNSVTFQSNSQNFVPVQCPPALPVMVPPPLSASSIPPPAPINPGTIPSPSPLQPYSIPPPSPIIPHSIPPPSPMVPHSIPPPLPIHPHSIPPPTAVFIPSVVPPPPPPAVSLVPTNYPPPQITATEISPPAPQNTAPPDLSSGIKVEPEELVPNTEEQQEVNSGGEDTAQTAPAFLSKPPWLVKQEDSAVINENSRGYESFPEDTVKSEVKTDDDNSTGATSGGEDSASARKKKRRSRWGDAPDQNDAVAAPVVPPVGVVVPTALGTVNPIVTPNPLVPTNTPTISVPGMSGAMLSKVSRSDPALVQYAIKAFGTSQLSEEDWKKAEDHYKINLLYQDMMRKRQELERLQAAGKHKYEYDSDEEIDGGTWEHKLREKEMEATALWAEELTEKAKGKHHIGDFLPPDELARFMEKYEALKQGREPDLSDYKEFKLKEDNIGFQMLQKLGWSEGQGLGSDGSGIVEPVNKASSWVENQGLGVERPDEVREGDDEYDAYRKRMMLAYRFRPNPLNNPRRPYY